MLVLGHGPGITTWNRSHQICSTIFVDLIDFTLRAATGQQGPIIKEQQAENFGSTQFGKQADFTVFISPQYFPPWPVPVKYPPRPSAMARQ